jgi:hypothetical protein
MPTNFAAAFGRSFAARTPEAQARSISVLDELGSYPFSQDDGKRRNFQCAVTTANKVYPPGVTAQMLAADPDAMRPEWVSPRTFWNDLEKMLAANPDVGAGDAAMADQARALVALYKSGVEWKTLLDCVALESDSALKTAGRYEQVGVDCGNGWQRQENGGVWGTDWFGRALAATIYIYVNDYREAMYLIRGTDSKGTLLNGRHRYTMQFAKESLPPVDRSRGGFWSLTMYDGDYFMLPQSPNGRSNIGSVSLDANELKFGGDGSLTLHLSHEEPKDSDAKANWLPAPDGQFALIIRAYVPTDPLLDGSYMLPNVERAR